MTAFAIITALVISHAIVALVGYAVGMTRGERDYPASAPLCVEVLEDTTGIEYIRLTGFYETQDEFIDALSAAIACSGRDWERVVGPWK